MKPREGPAADWRNFIMATRKRQAGKARLPAEAEEATSAIVTEELVWRGTSVSVVYKPDHAGHKDFRLSHLEVRVVAPEGAPLPVTDTGYRSHFLPAGIVEEEGGPARFVEGWLNAEAQTKAWRRIEARWLQPDLFG
jgi:hypothetical protein